jgi:xanthine dehydrogenase accessory factor
MHELHVILDAWRGLEASNRHAVLATVVHVTGSAYRRPGARMLILPNGQRIGSISGGCLEGDVSRKAWWFTEDGKPSVRVYDTSSDEDAVWEFGLGCNGVIHVLLERVESEACRNTLAFLDSAGSSGPATIATVIRTHGPCTAATGDRLFAGGGALHGTPIAEGLRPYIAQTLRERKSRLVFLRDCEVFVECILPPPSLLIFGAGHDAIPVAGLAKQLGWNITVADGRPAYATTARFPQADQVVVMRPGSPLADLIINDETLVVMMTHNYPQDGKLLPGILRANPRYLGMLGPKKRAERLFAEIGVAMSSVNVHAPAGLDIGAQTAEGIAVSIISEIQAELAGRAGMKLRHRQAPIHAPVEEAGEQREHSAMENEYATCEVS